MLSVAVHVKHGGYTPSVVIVHRMSKLPAQVPAGLTQLRHVLLKSLERLWQPCIAIPFRCSRCRHNYSPWAIVLFMHLLRRCVAKRMVLALTLNVCDLCGSMHHDLRKLLVGQQ